MKQHYLTACCALFMTGLLVAPSVRAADLADLDILPVRLIPLPLLEAGRGKSYWLYADVGESQYRPIRGLETANLVRAHYSRLTPGRSRFHLAITFDDDRAQALSIYIVATNKRCLLNTFDVVLTEGLQRGRTMEMTSLIRYRDPAILPTLGQTTTFCTADAGKLTLYFATPSFDMLQLTAVGHSAHGRAMSTNSVMLPLPTYQLKN